MNTAQNSQFMVVRLVRVTKKEARYLERTTARLRSQTPYIGLVKSLEQNDGRSAVLRASLEKTGPQLDNLLLAEELGWIESTQNWIELRELRNRLVHEYMESADDLLDALHQALDGVQALTATQLRMAAYAQKSLLP